MILWSFFFVLETF